MKTKVLKVGIRWSIGACRNFRRKGGSGGSLGIISVAPETSSHAGSNALTEGTDITDDGTKVFFHSSSDNLTTSGFGSRGMNLFMADLTDGTTETDFGGRGRRPFGR